MVKLLIGSVECSKTKHPEIVELEILSMDRKIVRDSNSANELELVRLDSKSASEPDLQSG